MNTEILRLENIVKSKGGVNTLNRLNMHLYSGEIMGVLSRSSVEKESLINILLGEEQPDHGRLYLEEQLLEAAKFQSNVKTRAFLVGKKSKLCHYISVAENVFLIRGETKKYIISETTINRQTLELFKGFDFVLDPQKDAKDLTPFERCVVEIIKSVAMNRRESKIIILDGLSDYLNLNEMKKINSVLNYIKSIGNTILYMDNDPDVLMEMSDRLLVLRDGKSARVFRRNTFSKKDLMAVFHGESNEYIPRGDELFNKLKDAPVVLCFLNVSTKKIDNLSVDINKGEIVSFFDQLGRCEEDIIELIMGRQKPESGEILYLGKAYNPWKQKPLSQGIGFICEDDLEKTMFTSWSVIENLSFLAINKYKSKFFSQERFFNSIYKEYHSRIGDGILSPTLRNVDTQTLYKILYYKWHLFSPKLLVCVRPFAGLDLSLRRKVSMMIDEIASKGAAVIVVSSNINEAYALGSRVIILQS